MLSAAPGMENAFIQPEIENQILELQHTLRKLCRLYLDGCNSIYSIAFYRISPPEISNLGQNETLQGGIRAFMAEVLGGPMGGFLILDESKTDIIQGIGAIPPTQENLMNLFTTPMLEVLQSLQASIYSLTDEAEEMYDDLLNPIVMPISMAAVCIRDYWFILMSIWSD